MIHNVLDMNIIKHVYVFKSGYCTTLMLTIRMHNSLNRSINPNNKRKIIFNHRNASPKKECIINTLSMQLPTCYLLKLCHNNFIKFRHLI